MNPSAFSTKSSVRSTQYLRSAVIQPLLISLFVFCLARDTLAAEAASFSDQLATLAAKCDELGLKREAEITRGWIVLRHPARQYLFLPTASDPTAPPAGASMAAKFWYAKFRQHRAGQARALFDESKQAIEKQEPARSYQLLHEVLREDPDHAEARRILGYVKRSSQWTTPEWERMSARPGAVPHPVLGMKYWRVDAPHFEIVTNGPKHEGLEAARQLENLHALWRQIFYRYWANQEGLAARFAGGNEPLAPPRPKMQVVVFKTREEYVAALAPTHPQIAITLGIYLDRDHKSFFYAGDTSVYPTWYHEATHQLFQEAVPGVADSPGEERNFWALEAAALYMESLKSAPASHREGCWTVGGCEADRLQFARYRALSGDFYEPLGRLATHGRTQIQESPDIRKLYAQAAGLAHFLIDGDGGKHRDAFTDLLTVIYQGDDQPDSLSKAAGVSYEQLDEQFRSFLDVTDDDLAHIPDVSSIRNLSLGRTSVTDAGLAHLAGCKNLEWLDLSLTSVGNEGLKSLAASDRLKQLFLEGTTVSDAGLAAVATFKQLEELDLSKLQITDDGLAHVANLKNLKILYLTGSPITDTGLAHLRGLKQLETLETTGTQVTPEGLKKLKVSLPKLQVE